VQNSIVPLARVLRLDSFCGRRVCVRLAYALSFQAISGVDYDRLLIDFLALQNEAGRAQADANSAAALCAAAPLAKCEAGDAAIAALDLAAPVSASSSSRDRLARRADVRAQELVRDAARSDAALAAARPLPDLTFRVGYTRDTFTVSGDLANSLGLSVSSPLPFFDRGQHARAEALSRAAQAGFLADATVTRAEADVAGLFARKRALEQSLATLDRDGLPRANGVLIAIERGLRGGQLDITDLLLARRDAIALRLRALEQRFELFSVRKDLRQALGLDEALEKD
jgi:cobalt-zinc-cadmium efflux system outer membrane protein